MKIKFLRFQIKTGFAFCDMQKWYLRKVSLKTLKVQTSPVNNSAIIPVWHLF